MPMGIEWGLVSIGVLFTIFVLPFWVIMHYITKWKATRGLSEDEQRMLERLWQESERFDSRLGALETILDAEVPNWRNRL